MMAGTDTSAISVQWVIAELINHPKVFKKLRGEINSVVGPNRLVRESDIPNLPYLHTVVKETLRLHPPSLVVLRASIEDCEINGFDVKANTRMLVMSTPSSETQIYGQIPRNSYQRDLLLTLTRILHKRK